MKKLLIAVLALLVVGALVLFLLSSSMLGSAVKTGVEAYAPRITGTPVTLDSARVSLIGGSGSLSGLTIGNPEGYASTYAIKVNQMDLDLKPRSLTSDVIHIERIYVNAPAFNYERTLRGGNMDTILKNIQAATGSREPAADDDAEVRMIIDEVVIENGQVALSAVGRQLTASLPRLELRDIGKEAGGVTPEQAALEVMQVVLREVIGVGLDAVRNGRLNLGEGSNEAIQQAGRVLEGILGGQKQGE